MPASINCFLCVTFFCWHRIWVQSIWAYLQETCMRPHVCPMCLQKSPTCHQYNPISQQKSPLINQKWQAWRLICALYVFFWCMTFVSKIGYGCKGYGPPSLKATCMLPHLHPVCHLRTPMRPVFQRNSPACHKQRHACHLIWAPCAITRAVLLLKTALLLIKRIPYLTGDLCAIR